MSTPARLIAAARRRIRRRHMLRTAAVGGWVGIGLAAATLIVSRFWWPMPSVPEWSVALGLAVVAVLVGLVVGRLRPVLGERELALLVDRALGTDEVLVTLLHLEEKGQAPPAVQEDLERRVASLPAVSRGVTAGPPRHAWMVPVGAALAALLLLIPQRQDAVARPQDSDVSPVEEEAARLEEALEEIDEEFGDTLPDELQQEMDQLLEDLDDDALSPEEAQERIEKLQDQLAEWEESLDEATSEDEQALQEAADALREGETNEKIEAASEALADALEEGDMEEAADAVEDLMEKLGEAEGEDAQKAGEAMERAGEALKNAGGPELQQAGEALEKAGRQMQDNGSLDGGEQGPQSGESARKSLEDLAKQLQEGGDLSKRMKEDAEKLKKSQELNGALEASRQRLGGEAGVEQGQGEQGQGEGQEQGAKPCTPEAQAAGQCVNAQGGPCTPEAQAAGQCVQAGGQGSGEAGTGLESGMAQGEPKGPDAGKGHTWEDEGTHDTTQGHQDKNRLSDRTEGEMADDFEAFYDPVRMDGAEGLVTKVEGRIDESGQIDSLPTRRTDGDETAKVKLLDVPDVYVDAADEALANERVPPGYRGAVKDYFDSME